MPNAKKLWNDFKTKEAAMPKAQRQFVGREEARKEWGNLLAQALEEDFKGSYVLQYYGTGGYGKSALLRQLREDLAGKGEASKGGEDPCKRARELLYKKNRAEKPATLQVDFDDPTIATVQDVLVRFRDQIMRQRDEAMFPLFDLAMTRLAQKYGTRVPPAEQKKAVYDKPVVAFVLDLVGDLTGLGDAFKAGKKALTLSREMVKALTGRQDCIQRANTEISRMTAPELAQYLPYYFAMDVNAMEIPLVCVYLDSYEKMCPRDPNGVRTTHFDEAWLWGEKGLVQSLGNAVFAVAGREPLTKQLDKLSHLEPKDGVREMAGLSEGESAAYLTGCHIEDRTVHRAMYDRTQGVPYELDLCVEEYEKLPPEEKQNMFQEQPNKTEEWVNQRYLADAGPKLRDGVRILCALGRWNDELYRELSKRLIQLPREGEADYKKLFGLRYIERQGNDWTVFRPVAEILAKGLDEDLRLSLVKVLVEVEALDVLVGMRPLPATLQGAQAMERRAKRNITLGEMEEARRWQGHALEQWTGLREEEPVGYLAAVAQMADILDRMAFEDERDRVLEQGTAFVKELGEKAPVKEAVALWERKAKHSGTWDEEAVARQEVLDLYRRQAPTPRVMCMAQCRLGWALYGCDESDPDTTKRLLQEAFQGLKKADRVENRPFSPYTLYAAEVLCQFAENIQYKLAYMPGDGELLEATRTWMREQTYALTGEEPLEELRLWQEWLDLNDEKRANIHCGLSLEGLYELQRKVMEGLRNHLGPQNPETLWAQQMTVKGYLRAHEDQSGLAEFVDATGRTCSEGDPSPLGSKPKAELILFEDSEFVIGCCRDLVEMYKLYVGREHLDTFWAMNLLARTCDGAGEYEEAVRCRWEALDIFGKLRQEQKEKYRKEAYSVLSGLVNDYEHMGRWDQAAAVQLTVLESRELLLAQTEAGTAQESDRTKPDTSKIDYERLRLGELFLEWLWQGHGRRDWVLAELLKVCDKLEDKGNRQKCMDSAWEWCQTHEDQVGPETRDKVRQAWKESGGREE